MSTAITVLACLAVTLGVGLLIFAFRSSKLERKPQPASPAPMTAAPLRTEYGSLNVVRPSATSVEGLEIQYERSGIVRSVRVGAMNSEHKELLLTMDDVAWNAMPNAQKQEVLAAARSTWASKMCPSGPDIAYVIIKTECGEVVGRASPRTVTIL